MIEVEEPESDEPSSAWIVGKLLLITFPAVVGTLVIVGGLLFLLLSWLTHGFDLSPFPGE